MPLTKKGRKIKAAMKKQYGKKKGERVFYASENKGTVTGVAKDSGDGKPKRKKRKKAKTARRTKIRKVRSA
jgi:hypothetical protein